MPLQEEDNRDLSGDGSKKFRIHKQAGTTLKIVCSVQDNIHSFHFLLSRILHSVLLGEWSRAQSPVYRRAKRDKQASKLILTPMDNIESSCWFNGLDKQSHQYSSNYLGGLDNQVANAKLNRHQKKAMNNHKSHKWSWHMHMVYSILDC